MWRVVNVVGTGNVTGGGVPCNRRTSVSLVQMTGLSITTRRSDKWNIRVHGRPKAVRWKNRTEERAEDRDG